MISVHSHEKDGIEFVRDRDGSTLGCNALAYADALYNLRTTSLETRPMPKIFQQPVCMRVADPHAAGLALSVTRQRW